MDARRRNYLDALDVPVYTSVSRALAEPPSVEAAPLPVGATSPAPSWDTLQATVAACAACALARGRTQTVFGVGDRNARWMVVGEAAGAPRDRVYIANTLKCRPPDNRDPEPDELAACRAFLDRQIALVEPELILAVGRIASQTLLNSTQPIGKLRGTVHRYGERGVALVCTYHPAYLLRSPGQKRRAWDDLKLALGVAAPLA